ncbi:T9SS type A sorting domain-containing protein [Bacteroidales bacterium OttesenSCG-928-K22]|nr:T9SS type A sorting domain-containing protein [Bacteroidales bacterium OttesenSCG-928-L14]MDL2240555.1 T9SS type A sorting domain-containing protein [Bacteroidales bacterium OttesenSCG-928-K22]
MKKLLLILLVLLIEVSTTNAQDTVNKYDYRPTLEEGRVWTVSLLDLETGTTNVFEYERCHFILLGDTTIDDKVYNKMYVAKKQNPIFPIDWSLRCFLREDIISKKIWCKQNNPNLAEMLYYDFSLQIGDTVPKQLSPISGSVTIIDITYETMSNGEEYKTLWLSDNTLGEFWMEGIGSSGGIIYPLRVTMIPENLLKCYYEDETLLYYNPKLDRFGECEFPYGGIENNYQNTIIMYPNPVRDIIYLDNICNSIITSISLTNIQGQKIKQYEPATKQINVANIPSGIYFIRFSIYSGKDIIEKVIIEK